MNNRVTVRDNASKRYITLEPMLSHSLPAASGGDLLCFEAYDERVKAFHQRQLDLGDFKVVNHKGFVVGVRSSLRAPRGIYPTIAVLQKRLFDQFKDAIVSVPVQLRPHPLVHVIPDGYPGAGVIVVLDTAGLSLGRSTSGTSFVEKAALGRGTARRTLQELGFVLREADGKG